MTNNFENKNSTRREGERRSFSGPKGYNKDKKFNNDRGERRAPAGKPVERKGYGNSYATSKPGHKYVEVNVHPKYKPGDVVDLKVLRTNENGAFLDGGMEDSNYDILLHKLQQTSEVKEGDVVKVYLYLDPSKRLTASMKLPKMREGQIGYVKVLSVTRDGGFVDIGAERGVFLPYSQMHGHVTADQMIWVKLYRDKTGRPAVTMRVEEEMQRASKPASETGVKVGDTVTGTIYNIVEEGFFIFTLQRNIAFMHRSEVPGGRLNFGEKVTARVAFIREDGRINLALRPQKEEALVPDAEAILKVLVERGGRMPYCDSTPPEIIKQKFGLSKAAFKRALGHLMKEGKIGQDNGWTILIEA